MITAAALVVVTCALAASGSEAPPSSPPAQAGAAQTVAPELRGLSVLELEDLRRALLARQGRPLDDAARAQLEQLDKALVRARRLEPIRRWRPGKRLPYEAVKRLELEELLALYVRASLELELDGFDARSCERVQALADLPRLCDAWRVQRAKPRLSRRDAATVEKIERALASAVVVSRCGGGVAAGVELARIRQGRHPRAGDLVESALSPSPPSPSPPSPSPPSPSSPSPSSPSPSPLSPSSPWPRCTRG